MRINIMSDLHNEFGKLEGLKGGETLLLAGDIGLAASPSTYMPFLEEACDKYEHVVMIMGNHEHYHGNFKMSAIDITDTTRKLSNFYLLENNYVKLDDVIILGCTLWSDISYEHEHAIAWGMNDFKIIKNFDVERARERHHTSVKFLTERLGHNRDAENIVVMTHHAPSLQVPEIYRGNVLNSAYGSDLEYLIEEYKPSLWVHGHTHVSRQYQIGETPIVCNPRGYVGHELNPEFNIDLEVEI